MQAIAVAGGNAESLRQGVYNATPAALQPQQAAAPLAAAAPALQQAPGQEAAAVVQGSPDAKVLLAHGFLARGRRVGVL